ncbi:MAG TPA: hypothetical protein VF550_18615 [Polyangia bacterium]
MLRFLGLFAVAGLVTARLVGLAHAPATDFDDAYMYLRYANHVLAGQGMAWNPGEGSVYGVTSLLHLTMVVLAKSVFPWLAPAALLQVVSGGAAIGLLAALIGIAALCSRHARLRQNWFFWTALIMPLVAFREAFAFHASTGMDTMVSALVNAVLVFFTLQFARSPSLSRAWWTALASLLAVLARPDNLLCALLCPVLGVLFFAPRPRSKPLAAFAVMVGGLLGTLVFAEWRWLGSPMPLSFFAKLPFYYGGFAGEFGWNPFLFLKVFAQSAWPFVVVLILFADQVGIRRAAVLLVPALASMAALCRFNQIMGHLGRFYFPFLPFFVAVGALEFDAWLGRMGTDRATHSGVILRRAVVAITLTLFGSISLWLAADWYSSRAQAQKLVSVDGFHTPAQTPLPDLDSWQSAYAVAEMARAAPAQASFAMSEHGLPGALAPQTTIIDVLGLHDPYFARHGFSATELFRRKPDVIWLPHSDHTQMLRDILDSDEFWNHYAFYPDAFFHGIALRTDSPHSTRLADLLWLQWQKAYPGLPMADYQAVRGY